MVDCLTDNKNRTTPEVRTAFSKNGGNLGETGCVNYLFVRRGDIVIEAGHTTEDEIMELLLDYDIEDIKTDEGTIEIVCSAEAFNDVNDVLTGRGFKLSMSEISMIPQTTVALDEKKAGQCLRLIELLEDLDDVQNVYSNYDISDEIMMKLSEGQ
jgi:YebC/PmpR family DNA-binding regulatory protein